MKVTCSGGRARCSRAAGPPEIPTLAIFMGVVRGGAVAAPNNENPVRAALRGRPGPAPQDYSLGSRLWRVAAQKQ